MHPVLPRTPTEQFLRHLDCKPLGRNSCVRIAENVHVDLVRLSELLSFLMNLEWVKQKCGARSAEKVYGSGVSKWIYLDASYEAA